MIANGSLGTLLEAYNRGLKEFIFPTRLKCARLVLLHKGPSKLVDDLSSFQLLCMLDTIDDNIKWIDPTVNDYERFIGMVKGTAKRYIPEATDTNIFPAGIRKATDCMQNIKGMAKQKSRTNS
ncbi:Hypothetical protein CINCED_3A004590 [Cinara cedri]|uniref:Uncharacterized protein n=1 Tax=Cinara cedri TaxID=506608 RepID=A0A5E4N0N2_9HEMI|nr:Hypothetical protein CINCED_3A004590 [Cinara cedri]